MLYAESYINYNTYLMRMKPDGSQRENLTGSFNFYDFEWFIHRGYFYCSTDSSVIRIPLDSPKSEPQILYKTDYYIESGLRAVSQICAYKNYFYFTADERNEKEEGPGLSIKCINLDTLEINDIPKAKGYQVSYNFFLDNTMIASYYDKNSDENVYLKCDLDGNVKESFFTIAHKDNLRYSTDGKYIYGDNCVQVTRKDAEKQIITVYDLNMNEIDSYAPPEFENIVCNNINPQDNEYFIFESVDDNGERILAMADKSQLGSIGGETIKFTELCKLKWAEKKNSNYYVEGQAGVV